jgi:hypothetical protein
MMDHKSNYLIFFSVLALCFGCQRDKTLSYQGEEIAYYPKKDFSIEGIKIDTLTNESFFYSGLGSWVIFNNSLTLLDQRLDSAYVFSDELVHRSTYLGKGDGPNLLTGIIVEHTVMNDNLVILGANDDYHLINTNWEIEQSGQLDFYHEKTPYEELLKNPKASYISLYGPLRLSKLSHDYKGNIVFSVEIPHPDLNYLWHETYYREARILGRINPDDGKVEIQGRYSNIYNQYQFLSTLRGVPFTYINADTYIQGYEADSIMYKLTDDGEANYAFGVAGKEMNTAYENFNAETVEEYDAVWDLDRERYSYYVSLDYVQETGLLLRGYTKSNPLVDGLQIYREDTLIGDVEVPKDFRFVGYKAPYYYAEFRYRADKEEEPIKLLRFELPEN